MRNNFLNDLFVLLDENKQFPSYQAERRIDIFINYFLEDILEAHYKSSKITFIAPEFPLKLENSFQATHIDYLCLKEGTEGEKEILFVELKTDANSFDPQQLKIYSKYKTWNKWLEELIMIIQKGRMSFDYRLKYFHLIRILTENHLLIPGQSLSSINIPDANSNHKVKLAFSKEFNSLLSSTDSRYPEYRIQIVYIAPEGIKHRLDRIKKPVGLITFQKLMEMPIKTKFQDKWKLICDNLLRNIDH